MNKAVAKLMEQKELLEKDFAAWENQITKNDIILLLNELPEHPDCPKGNYKKKDSKTHLITELRMFMNLNWNLEELSGFEEEISGFDSIIEEVNNDYASRVNAPENNVDTETADQYANDWAVQPKADGCHGNPGTECRYCGDTICADGSLKDQFNVATWWTGSIVRKVLDRVVNTANGNRYQWLISRYMIMSHFLEVATGHPIKEPVQEYGTGRWYVQENWKPGTAHWKLAEDFTDMLAEKYLLPYGKDGKSYRINARVLAGYYARLKFCFTTPKDKTFRMVYEVVGDKMTYIDTHNQEKTITLEAKDYEKLDKLPITLMVPKIIK